MTDGEDMTIEVKARFPSSVRLFSRSAAAFTILIGGIVLLGWIFDVAFLKSVLPGLVTMKVNTALAFILSGTALWLLRTDLPDRYRRSADYRIARVCAGVVAAVGLLTMSEYLFGRSLGIDQLLFKEAPGAIGTSSPGRMAPNTAFSFVIVSFSLLLLDSKSSRLFLLSHLLALAAAFIAWAALLGYFYNIKEFYGIANYTKMALHTSVTFTILSVGILFSRPDRGFMAVIIGENVGSVLMRRLIPAAILLTTIVGWLRWRGEIAGIYPTAVGMIIMVLATTVMLSVTIFWTGVSLNRADRERERAEEDMKRNRDHLDELVAERTAELAKTNEALRVEIIERRRLEEIAKLEEARLRSVLKISQHPSASMRELLDLALDEAIALSGSKFGYLYYYNEDTREFTLHAWSKDVMKECAIREPQTIYQLEKTGLWGEAVRQRKAIVVNDFSAPHPLKKGYPEGHASLFRYFTIPVFSEGRIVAVVGIANKPTDYTDADVNQLTFMMDSVWKIIERKQAEEEIRRMNEELEQRVVERTSRLEATNKELEAFSYSISHDLRAPLRGIDGFSNLLLKDYGDKVDGQGKDYLQRVRNATQHMGQLIDELLKLSRITRVEMRREKVNLSGLAATIVDELHGTNPDRHVEFIIQEGLIEEGDPHLLEIALQNLLNNAWKYSRNKQTATIEFGSLVRDNSKVYFVRDNGAGFDMRYVDKLFGAFQRLHSANEFEGTGIGLATVQHIIHRHGGNVWAEGEVNNGATFYFTIG